jgi:hypothetical protein
MIDSSLAVFSPGSSHPASILYDALEHFDAKSPKADEAIRSIRPDLAGAVDTCIEAAGREVDTYWQKRLLKVSHRSGREEGSMSWSRANARLLSLEGLSWIFIIPVNSLLWVRR